MGIRIPDELSIIGFGDCHRNSVFMKMLTSVVIDEYELGVQAAKILCQMKKEGKVYQGQPPQLLELSVLEGKTVSKIDS